MRVDGVVRSCRALLAMAMLIACAVNLSAAQQDSVSVPGVYRVYAGSSGGFDVWIVDGKIIRDRLIPQFLYGGNPRVYPSIPSNEIWIDHAISCEEYNYTVAHELRESELMADRGWAYGAAHDSALMVEEKLRMDDLLLAVRHEHALPRIGTSDYYGEKELPRLGDSLRLVDVYRVYAGQRDSMDVWIVDGTAIRRDIYPDFGLSGNDLAYHFIPHGEIWLDAQVSCEEMEYSIRFELAERAFIAGGMPYDDAYEKALLLIRAERLEMARRAAAMPPIPSPKELHAIQ